MHPVDEILDLDALGQADRLRRGDVHPSELVEAAVARIERLNPDINAVVTPMFDAALEEAAGLLPQGPFTGVPFLVKDATARVGGVRLTWGSRLAGDYTPDHDSEIVQRHRRAGLIIVGKTNCPEFGLVPTTEPVRFGPTRNPLDMGLSAGGSSGGSAAAVAAGMVPMAHANDGGGSIRIPAACCGLIGLKPTRARTPLGPDLGDVMGGLLVEHAVTRSVRDSAALLDATAGPDLGDPYWAPPYEGTFLEAAGRDPGRLRVGFSTHYGSTAAHPDCVAAVEATATRLSELGHSVEEAAPDYDHDRLAELFTTVWVVGAAQSVVGISSLTGIQTSSDTLEPLTMAMAELGRAVSATEFVLTQQQLQGVSRRIAGFFLDYDLWLTPTLAKPAVQIGELDPAQDDPLAAFHRAYDYCPFTPIANVTGHPALSLSPAPVRPGVAVQLQAGFGCESTLLSVAAQLMA
jgi:amidase